jgi:hypothetical protein
MAEKRGNRFDRPRCPAASGLLAHSSKGDSGLVLHFRLAELRRAGWGWPGGPRKFDRAGTHKEARFEEAEIGVY